MPEVLLEQIIFYQIYIGVFFHNPNKSEIISKASQIAFYCLSTVISQLQLVFNFSQKFLRSHNFFAIINLS